LIDFICLDHAPTFGAQIVQHSIACGLLEAMRGG
jgi:hypothetical protein